jgi:uncharacterized membrane protein YebE (DUF533 family)
MNPEDIVGSILRGALGGRKKRSRRAVRYMTREKGGFLNASTLLAAAGVAWGAYEAYRRQSSPSGFGGPTPPSPSGAIPPVPGVPTPRAPGVPPPLPTASGLPEPVIRAVRLLVSAARADGTLSEQERARIVEHARQAGAEPIVQEELDRPRPLAEIVAGIAEPAQRQELYVLAFTVVRADESVSGAERIYLAQLASQLGLDPATTARLEADTAAAIDAEPES